MEWASRITTLSFSMPVVLGAWLDRTWDTAPWGVMVGLGLGFAAGIAGFGRLIREQSRPGRRPTPNERGSSDGARR
jgi:F0F1-type ATP synthase assembly protein I